MLRPVRRKKRVLGLAVLVILVAVNAALIALLWSQRQIIVEPTGHLLISTAPETSAVQVGTPSTR